MGLNRREVLRWGAVGAAGAMLSSAASSVGLPSIVYAPPPVPRDPLAPLAPVQPAPVGLNPVLFQKAKAALDSHRYQARARDVMGYTFIVCLALTPVVVILVTLFGMTLHYPL